jgi:hypothetical protein
MGLAPAGDAWRPDLAAWESPCGVCVQKMFASLDERLAYVRFQESQRLGVTKQRKKLKKYFRRPVAEQAPR